MTQLLAFSILALTIGLALGRPKIGRWRLQHAGAATVGAALTLMLGIVSPGLALQTLKLLFFPVVTIASLMTITLVAEQVGLLQILARYVAKAARGDARKLFTYLFVSGTMTGTVFTNDAAILIFTPMVFALIEEVQMDSWTLENKIPFYFSVLYVGNLVGALVISNPINIVVSSFFGIRFADYASWMIIPAVVSMVVSYLGLRLFFRNVIPRTYRVPDEARHDPLDRGMVIPCAIVLALTLLGFFSEDFTGLPTWLVALASASTLLVMHGLRGHSTVRVIRGVGWDVIVFVVGIFLVVVGLRNAGFAHLIAGLINQLGGQNPSSFAFATGFIAAIFSSLFNNHPTAGLMIFVLKDLSLPVLQTKMLVFAALIGGDLGPKMLPIGSLAALMWFRILRERGVDIPYSLYIKIGVPVTLAAVFLSLVALNLEWLIHAKMSQ